ncbi:hypothetical protein N657DRAFT_209152 [Parathielavia appendiculata]|uniref:Uncharacterized protein n=1 Tax=Parathielavia appendiculata TaxID=2587402 RepID=A0AAN6Z7R9_9PEZI|nr:hypothetical protein N657DRAFT_209152 [Parathielavia appendiculata]
MPWRWLPLVIQAEGYTKFGHWAVPSNEHLIGRIFIEPVRCRGSDASPEMWLEETALFQRHLRHRVLASAEAGHLNFASVERVPIICRRIDRAQRYIEIGTSAARAGLISHHLLSSQAVRQTRFMLSSSISSEICSRQTKEATTPGVAFLKFSARSSAAHITREHCIMQPQPALPRHQRALCQSARGHSKSIVLLSTHDTLPVSSALHCLFLRREHTYRRLSLINMYQRRL